MRRRAPLDFINQFQSLSLLCHQKWKNIFSKGCPSASKRPVRYIYKCYYCDKMMMRSKLRGGIATDIALIGILFVLVYVFITRRSYTSGFEDEPVMAGNTAKRSESSHSHPDGTKPKVSSMLLSVDGESQHLIDSRVKSIPDFRPSECRGIQYKVKDKVTIIIEFYDFEFYDLKTTISGVLQNTPEELIAEILLINDGSTLTYIEAEAEKYMKTLKKGRMLKNDEQLGSAKARMKAFAEAKTDIVIFMDHSVITNQGWLEPLIQTLEDNPESMVVPHYDHVNDPVSYEFKATAEKLISTFSWRMITRVTESKTEKKSGLYYSPVLRGSIFGVRRDYFTDIGGYEDSFEEYGGENLELSVRSWLCGGPIFVVPCSRVGILNLNDPIKIQSHKNIRRIAELWFSDFKDIIYRSTNVDSTISDAEKNSISGVKSKWESRTCKKIDWYIAEIVRDIASPSEKAKHFGLLRCKTGRCARLGKDGRIDLGQCSPDRYGVHSTDMLFEYSNDKRVMVNGKCLSTQKSAYILGVDCVEGDNHQLYDYNEKLELKNAWSGYCLMHVTDPDKTTGGKRQIAMAQDCKTDTSGGQFVQWEFIAL